MLQAGFLFPILSTLLRTGSGCVGWDSKYEVHAAWPFLSSLDLVYPLSAFSL